MDEEYLLEPKEWSATTLGWFMAIMGPVSSVFDILTFIFCWFYLGYTDPNNAAHVTLFQSCWFLEGFMTQSFIVHMIRTPKIPFFQSIASKWVMLMTCCVVAIGFMLPNISPLATAFSMLPPEDIYYPFLFAMIVGYMTLSQLIKLVYIRAFGTWL